MLKIVGNRRTASETAPLALRGRWCARPLVVREGTHRSAEKAAYWEGDHHERKRYHLAERKPTRQITCPGATFPSARHAHRRRQGEQRWQRHQGWLSKIIALKKRNAGRSKDHQFLIVLYTFAKDLNTKFACDTNDACVSARGLDYDRRGVQSCRLNEINDLRGSPGRRQGSFFDQYLQAGKCCVSFSSTSSRVSETAIQRKYSASKRLHRA
jgi:hypothetical protein